MSTWAAGALICVIQPSQLDGSGKFALWVNLVLAVAFFALYLLSGSITLH